MPIRNLAGYSTTRLPAAMAIRAGPGECGGLFWMSGVLAIAGVMNVPVVGCKEGVIGWWIRRNGVGLCYEHPSPENIGSSLAQVIHEPGRFIDALRAGRLREEHAIEHAQDLLFG